MRVGERTGETISGKCGPFLLRALHERRDRCRNALIDEDQENLFLVAKKNSEAAAGRNYGTELVHFDNGLTHTASLCLPSCEDPNHCPHLGDSTAATDESPG
jgi:hypothetical protein